MIFTTFVLGLISASSAVSAQVENCDYCESGAGNCRDLNGHCFVSVPCPASTSCGLSSSTCGAFPCADGSSGNCRHPTTGVCFDSVPCPADTSCVEDFDCFADGDDTVPDRGCNQKKPICVSDENKPLEPGSGGYKCRACINTVEEGERPGTDFGCDEGEKCVWPKSGKSPKLGKGGNGCIPLQCPELPPGTIGICVEECFPGSCPAGQLCCSNGCGHVCKYGV